MKPALCLNCKCLERANCTLYQTALNIAGTRKINIEETTGLTTKIKRCDNFKPTNKIKNLCY